MMYGKQFLEGLAWGAGFTAAWIVVHVLARLIGAAA